MFIYQHLIFKAKYAKFGMKLPPLNKLYNIKFYYQIPIIWKQASLCAIVSSALNWEIVVSEFEIQLRYCVHFRANTL